MKNKENLKKRIIYRSTHRGTKEMDVLLGLFVKQYIDKLNISALNDLDQLLIEEDEILYNFYFKKSLKNLLPVNKVSILFKNFKL